MTEFKTEWDKLFIGGEWRDPSTDEVIEVHSPATGEYVGRVPMAAAADVNSAVAAARQAFDEGPWPSTPPAERAAVIQAAVKLLEDRKDYFTHLLTGETGQPPTIIETMHWLGSMGALNFFAGAADAVTWVVGFALIADLYGPAERGRVMGFVMSGTSFGLMIGPSLGGWLYETGGMKLPFLTVAALAVVAAVGFAWLRLPDVHAAREAVPLGQLLRVRAVAICALTVVVATRLLGRPALAPAALLVLCGLSLLTCRLLLIPVARLFGRRRENLALVV